MKRLYLLLIPLLLLTGCSSAPWFAHQGINFTECGPTTAAMTLRWAGKDGNRHQARQQLETAGMFWGLDDISDYLDTHGLEHEVLLGKPETSLEQNTSLILLTTKAGLPHFVFITKGMPNRWWVHDPLGGSYLNPVEAVQESMVSDVYLKVAR